MPEEKTFSCVVIYFPCFLHDCRLSCVNRICPTRFSCFLRCAVPVVVPIVTCLPILSILFFSPKITYRIMNREIHKWWSPRLNKDMEIAVYGHWGFPLLMFPTAGADYLEYERFYMIDCIKEYIEAGKVKVFSINSINNESWLNRRMHPRHKSLRHGQYNNYVSEEVAPFIWNHIGGRLPIITTGASLGALHGANMFFRRPDIFGGTIAMSGVYDLTEYSDGYMDEDVYFNSPIHYLSNLSDHDTLENLRRSNHIHILSGSGAYEAPDASRKLSWLLSVKGISHELDIWGADMRHDWPTWRAMLPHYLATRF